MERNDVWCVDAGMATSPAQFVSAAEIARNFGRWQDAAATGPIVVTSHGRARVAVIGIEAYEQLSQGRAAEASGAELAILLDHMSEAFVAFDTQLAIRVINAAARSYWAIDERGLIGQGLVYAFPMLDDGVIVGQLRRVLSSHEKAGFEAPSHLYPDRLLRFRAFPYPGGVAMTFSDVADETDAKRETARRFSLRTAGEAHRGIGTASVTLRGSFAQADRPFAEIADTTVATLLRGRLIELFAPDRRTAVDDTLGAALTGAGPQVMETALLVADGERAVRIAFAEIREGYTVSGATVLLTAERRSG